MGGEQAAALSFDPVVRQAKGNYPGWDRKSCRMVPILAALLLLSSSKAAAQSTSNCAVVKEFVGTAPSDIVQKKFAARFDVPLNRVDCRDNGLCYQKWGKGCSLTSK